MKLIKKREVRYTYRPMFILFAHALVLIVNDFLSTDRAMFTKVLK